MKKLLIPIVIILIVVTSVLIYNYKTEIAIDQNDVTNTTNSNLEKQNPTELPTVSDTKEEDKKETSGTKEEDKKEPKEDTNVMIKNRIAELMSVKYDNSLDDAITYDWPTEEGEAILSDKYFVTLSQNGKTVFSEVIMSESKDVEISDFAMEFKGRTFNWTSFSSDFSSPITVTVEKLFGDGADKVEIVPSPLKVTPTLSEDKKKVSFTLTEPHYVSINFKSLDNRHTSDGVIKHMLMIFAEPLEKDVPNKTDEGVHVYSAKSTKEDLQAAKVIYFPRGYHNLSTQYSSSVGNLGEAISSNKEVYFEGGSYVHGRIYAGSASNVKIYGRGVLTGRDFKWHKNLDRNGGKSGVDSYPPNQSHINVSGTNNVIEGIIVCDGAGHGVNMGYSATYVRTKYWGWHCNNDGFRPWGDKTNIIDHCFIRSTDDALYNKSLLVTNTVFWPSFNGSILCLGWDGKYNTENSVLRDNYIIYPEWRNIGNNNGIVMSQLDYDMKGINVLIENLYIDGNIPALLNLHTNSNKQKVDDYTIDSGFNGTLGEVKNIVFKNVFVSGDQVVFDGTSYEQFPQLNKSLIRGAKLSDGSIFKISDITMDNVWVSNVLLTEENKDDYFIIDEETTENITFLNSN